MREANKTRTSVKVVACYTAEDQARAIGIIKDLGMSAGSTTSSEGPKLSGLTSIVIDRY
jgi:hypothetical protein